MDVSFPPLLLFSFSFVFLSFVSIPVPPPKANTSKRQETNGRQGKWKQQISIVTDSLISVPVNYQLCSFQCISSPPPCLPLSSSPSLSTPSQPQVFKQRRPDNFFISSVICTLDRVFIFFFMSSLWLLFRRQVSLRSPVGFYQLTKCSLIIIIFFNDYYFGFLFVFFF